MILHDVSDRLVHILTVTSTCCFSKLFIWLFIRDEFAFGDLMTSFEEHGKCGSESERIRVLLNRLRRWTLLCHYDLLLIIWIDTKNNFRIALNQAQSKTTFHFRYFLYYFVFVFYFHPCFLDEHFRIDKMKLRKNKWKWKRKHGRSAGIICIILINFKLKPNESFIITTKYSKNNNYFNMDLLK